MSRVLAAIYDRLMKSAEDACLAKWRGQLLGGMRGSVLEVGAGTGLNLAHYPSSIDKLVLTEPDPHMRRRLVARAAGRAEVLDAPAERLPFADGSFDNVVVTLVLCSVADLDRALAEIHRVLKPGGRFLFLEHVAADEHSKRFRWQRRIDPLWRRLMGHCRLVRRTEDAIVRAGFAPLEVQRESMRKALPIVRPTIRGVAIRAA